VRSPTALEIPLVDGQEGLLALRGVNGDGIDEAEAQLRLGPDYGGASARQKDEADSRSCASSRANGRACAPVRGCADQSAEPSARADGGGVLAMRSTARAFPKFSENGELAAIDDGEIREFDSQFGSAFDSAGFANLFYFPDDGLAAPGHDPAVYDNGVLQSSGELVADLVVIGGEIIIDARHEDGSSGNGQRGWKGLALRSAFIWLFSLVLSVGRVLAGPVV
jgi:hypothetical protein